MGNDARVQASAEHPGWVCSANMPLAEGTGRNRNDSIFCSSYWGRMRSQHERRAQILMASVAPACAASWLCCALRPFAGGKIDLSNFVDHELLCLCGHAVTCAHRFLWQRFSFLGLIQEAVTHMVTWGHHNVPDKILHHWHSLKSEYG